MTLLQETTILSFATKFEVFMEGQEDDRGGNGDERPWVLEEIQKMPKAETQCFSGTPAMF